MLHAISARTRAMIAVFAMAIYAFSAIMVPASAAVFDRPSTPCHMTIHQGGHLDHPEAGLSGHRHSSDAQPAASHARHDKGFPHVGSDCQTSCTLAVTLRIAPSFTLRTSETISFEAFAQNVDDHDPARPARPPKSLA